MRDLRDKKLFLLDMDGTIYLDDNLFDGTLDFLKAVKQNGARYLFLTNNSSKGADKYIEKMHKLGIETEKDDFLTSTDATILYIKSKYEGKRFYAMGTNSFVKQLKDGGIDAVTELCDDIFGLVISNDQELTFKKLDDVSQLLLRGVEYIATNPDWVCPTAYGSVPDCGSFAEMLSHVNGRLPTFIGKPKPEMIYLALEKYGLTKDDAVMIGDRLYTDIASGNNAGIDTIFVLSGEGTLEDLKTSEAKPTYIMQNIREVYNSLILE